jgi:anti-sigma regulatory factor (Ser/Thr protein kinase)
MIQEWAGDGFPGQWQHAGARTFSLCRDEIDRTAMAAHPSALAGSTGCRWLMLAAEMAGVASDNGRPSPHPASTGLACLPRIATRTLGAHAGSVGAGRDFTIATLHRWGEAERGQDIAIVVSELLTNALRHALPGSSDSGPRRPIRLGLLQPGPGVLCAVADPSKAAPVPQTPGSLAETGRGLHIVCALSDQWGYTPSDTGKVVWALFHPCLTVCVLLGFTALAAGYRLRGSPGPSAQQAGRR